MTFEEQEKETLEIQELKAKVTRTLQEVEHVPIKLYLAIGTVMGAGVIKIIEVFAGA